jgi:hypothetical protein
MNHLVKGLLVGLPLVAAIGCSPGLRSYSSNIAESQEPMSANSMKYMALSSVAGWSYDAAAMSQFTLSFTAIPSQDLADIVIGLSSNVPTKYDDLAMIVRFNSSGMIDVRNGGSYVAAAKVAYSAGVSYRFQMKVDLGTSTYSVTVTPEGLSAIVIAQNYAFRSEQANITNLANFATDGAMGSVSISNISISSATQASGPPLTFNDSRFANAVSVGAQVLSNGATLVDRSITSDGGAASILCDGSCTLNRVRVNSSEAVRITSGTILIQDSYLEATGKGDDHADVIQAYSPGSRGSLILRNTSIVAHNTAATAGIFIADNWKPDLVDLENVMFSGGPYGLRLHADGYAGAHLRMKNVCFVGPFMYGMYLIDSIVTIDEWTNVNECVIQNGKLVITKAIPHP